MEYNKPVILLCWNYDRVDWLRPFIELKNRFNFIFLSKYQKQEELRKLESFKTVYWINFSSPSEVLRKIQPDKVVFMSLSDSFSIMLNAACKRKGIKTYILQHGLFYDNKTYHNKIEKIINSFGLKNLPTYQYHKQKSIQRKIKTIKYISSELIFHLFEAPLFIRYLQHKKKKGEIIALAEAKHLSLKRPNQVICFTKQNAVIFKERDLIPDELLIPIGNPFIEHLFTNESHEKEKFITKYGQYALLIDTPLWSDNSQENKSFGFSKEEVLPFYNRLKEYCTKHDLSLVIKRHPYSYGSSRLLNGENTYYIDHCDNLNCLLQNAEKVFSFSSSLALPALCLRPTVLIRFQEDSFTNEMIEDNVVQVLDMQSLDLEDIHFSEVDVIKEKILERFLFKIDGSATFRLGEILE